ncbi:MAG: ABC transporter permease [Acidobacteriota bacterium]
MIKHMLKLVWNRKRINFLITLEIFFSFLVTFIVIVMAVYYIDNYRQPLGFSYENVWHISIDMKQTTDDTWTPEQVHTTRQLAQSMQEFPEVEMVAGALSGPYTSGARSGSYEINGRRMEFQINEVTDNFKELMGLNLIQGRWFNQQDNGVDWKPVVINYRLSRELFGNEDPLGKNIFPPNFNNKKDIRVIGVVTDFRKDGELAAPAFYVFERKDLSNIKERPTRNLLVKLRAGTTASFEEKLITKLQAVAKDWSFEITPLIELRESSLKFWLTPLIALGLVAIFLMIMVALGLTGVLWQSVTQRTKEIGLRRAKGATAINIYCQILGELFLIATIALVFGTGIVLQFPLLNIIGFVSAKVYLLSLLISLAIIYLLTLICGLYPSRLAMRIHPAEALHYE